MLDISAARIAGIRPELAVAMVIASEVFAERRCKLSCAVEAKHMAGSLHYVGAAFDIAISSISSVDVPQVVKALAERLGVDFDVLNETDHIHIEFQPKTGVNL